ncbi:MAG TPA: MFS transporter [Acetobacteraceae bacterium]|nr:MFS transporter [Acetobacteraceae bacterium]
MRPDQSVQALGPGSAHWRRLIPVAFVTYSLAYVDRANYGIGSAAGLAHDLGIAGKQDALLGALFSLGYFLCQIPAAWYAEAHSARRLMFWGLIAWGLLAALTGVITDIHWLYLDRLLLGVAESAVLPGMLIFLSHWFTRAERSRANSFLILGSPVTVLWMSIVSGYLAHAIGWRGMFIAEGVPTVIWAFAWWWLVRDTPAEAAWLPPRERDRIATALAREQQGLRRVKNYAAAFRTPMVIVLAIQYFCWGAGISGFIIWLPSMLKAGRAIGIVEIGWLSAAPYLLATVLMVLVSYWSDRSGRRRAFVWPFLIVGAAAFLGAYWLGRAAFWPGFMLLVVAGGAMYAPFGPFFAWFSETLPRNVAGGAIALINSCGALGGFIGAYAVGFINAATGGPSVSFLVMAVTLLISGVLTLTAREQVDHGRPESLRH